MARNKKWYGKRWHRDYHSWKASSVGENAWSETYKMPQTHDNYPAAWWTGQKPYRPYRQEGCKVFHQSYYQSVHNDCNEASLRSSQRAQQDSTFDSHEKALNCINNVVPLSVADDQRLTDLFMLADLPHIVQGILELLD